MLRFAVAAVPLCACAAVLGIDDGHPRGDGADGGGADGAPSVDATVGATVDGEGADVVSPTPDAQGTTESSSPGPDALPDAEMSDGAPPGDGATPPGDSSSAADANDAADATDSAPMTLPDGGALTCEYVPFDPATAIFVAGSGTDVPGCGTEAAPCRTIQNGINLAHNATSTTPNVYVADGTYREALTLKSGVTVLGGWTPSASGPWTRDCSAASTIIEAPAGQNVTVTAASLTSKLSTLSIVGGDPTPLAGESAFGIVATGLSTVLTLDWVRVTAGSGADGAPGTTGAVGTTPTGTCATPGDGGAGTLPGTKGVGADAGWFASTGYVLASAQPGNPGSGGADGARGGDAGCVSCVTCGGALCGATVTGANCGTPGQSGCGGGGGQGGTAGGSGGSSVAMLVVDATVVLTHCSFASGAGGHGAPGGAGGSGAGGSAGAAGGASASCTVGCGGTGVTGCTFTPGSGPGGSAGGHGGPGAGGGAGGDGAGGDSFAVVQLGNATVEVLDGGATFSFGSAGSGPDGGNGAAGRAGAQGP